MKKKKKQVNNDFIITWMVVIENPLYPNGFLPSHHDRAAHRDLTQPCCPREGHAERRTVTCFTGGGHYGRRGRPVPEPVDGRYGELVLGVRAQRPYRVVHGDHAADHAGRLRRRPGLVRYRVVQYVVRVGVRPAQLDRRGRHIGHFDFDRRTGKRCT